MYTQLRDWTRGVVTSRCWCLRGEKVSFPTPLFQPLCACISAANIVANDDVESLIVANSHRDNAQRPDHAATAAAEGTASPLHESARQKGFGYELKVVLQENVVPVDGAFPVSSFNSPPKQDFTFAKLYMGDEPNVKK